MKNGTAAPTGEGAAPPPGSGKDFLLAAPSWVVPGTVWENGLFLEGKVDEVALLMLETEASLAYGRQDLPPELASLALGWHVHLPVDLPWPDGEAAAAVCLALMEKVDFLQARRAVLHPPPAVCAASGDAFGEAPGAACRAVLAAFAKAWRKAGRRTDDILLENTGENDLVLLRDFFAPNGVGPGGVEPDRFGICPDLGHMLAYGQRDLAAMLAGLPEAARPRIVHCSAPGSGLPGQAPKSAHCPLDTLDAQGRAAGAALCALLAPGGVIVAELFDWGHIVRSLPCIGEWQAAARRN